MKLDPTPIIQQSKLDAICAKAAQQRFVTIDTEFVREHSYWPHLCLVQLATEDEAVAIDPLSADIDLGCFWDLMDNRAVIKVFHAARQDLEIFYKLSGRLPAPLFDTQVAAMVCGYGDSVGYESLVAAILGKGLDKSSRYSDWSKRPLSQRQIEYALGDVTHLRAIYLHLEEQLAQRGRSHWLDEEMAILSSPATYEVDTRTIWRKLKARSDKPQFLAILRELAHVRELEAQRRDLPRGRVLRDEALLEIASVKPKSNQALGAIRGFDKNRALGAFGDSLLEAISVAEALPRADCPQPFKRSAKLSGQETTIIELLKVLLQNQSSRHDVASKLLASSDDLRALVSLAPGGVLPDDTDALPDLPLLAGWRYEVFGKPALALLSGSLTIRIQDGQVVFMEEALQ